MNKKARLFAFYLPQYHPVQKNDEFWGKGFTEWTNMTKAKPLFTGHEQPLLAGELSYYDLRVPETRAQQSELAQAYGVDSFCYWHYWFGAGERVLERIFDEVLASGEPSMPFCLGWANESWTGRWHGLDDEFIFEQRYPGDEDFRKHFDTVLPAFKDARYSKVDGKPVFLVYRPQNLPDAKYFVELWDKWAKEAGLPGMYFLGVDDKGKCLEMGFDMNVPNAPWSGSIEHARIQHGLKDRLRGGKLPELYDYEKYVNLKVKEAIPDRQCPLVVSNWDNTPRSAHRGKVLMNATPSLYKEWLQSAVDAVQDRPEQERIIFIKSWNEWAEGNHIEPDAKWGRAYLEVTKSVITDSQ